MTFQLTVLYLRPHDPAAFDDHYARTHAPLVLSIPGLRGFTTVHPGPDAEGRAPAEHLVATLVFDDATGFAEGMTSPEGQAAAQDVATFATGGATLLTGEVTTYR